MKRYILFAGPNYYPGGGAGDFVESSDDLEALKEKGRELITVQPETEERPWPHCEADWAHIWDCEEEKEVEL